MNEPVLTMLPCTGCKHLRTEYQKRAVCLEPIVGGWTWAIDPTTGRGYNKCDVELKYGLGLFENTTERMRAVDMPCGPERKLYTPKPPNFWQRLW